MFKHVGVFTSGLVLWTSLRRTTTMKRLSCGLAVVALLLQAVGQVRSDFMYWNDFNDGHIRRANLDGSGQEILVSGLTTPTGLALDLTGGRMYFAARDAGSIYSANLDGSGQTTLVEGLFQPTQVALDVSRGQVYWAYGAYNFTGGVHSANLDGSALADLVSGIHGALGIALDVSGGKMYVSEGFVDGAGTIRRYNLDGSSEEILLTGLSKPSYIALDVPGAKMYFGNTGDAGTVHRANLDGSSLELLVSRPPIGIPGITLDLAGGKMYWTEYGSGTIGRANLDGSGQETLLTGLAGPAGIALQIEPAPVNRFQITAASTAVSGTPFDVMVTALDAAGNIDTSYQGTVTFSTSDSDPRVMLPADYTFTIGDGGDNCVHPFPGGVILATQGDQTLTVTDKLSGISGSITITVGPGP